MNRLKNQRSPYLLQHANNPVHWYPWCPEAFEEAAKKDLPVFLSIGYSTCHWCHVMAEESFENEEIAALLNRRFISIKVDREERPDIDHVYMRACQAATGSGGWPLSLFLTPDKEPFFAGTYFPPGAFQKLVRLLGDKWDRDRKRLLESGRQLRQAVEAMDAEEGAAGEDAMDMEKGNAGEDTRGSGGSKAAGQREARQNDRALERQLMSRALDIFRDSFDSAYGGFGQAPKFPSPHNLLFLLSLSPPMAEKTLLQMYKGGIFDHIGGGFCRYATDDRWLIPHFEKMLYDNALLTMTYLTAYAKTGRELYKIVAEKILLYLKEEMAAAEGGFYAAQDADTEGQEGGYYLLTPRELKSLLGEEDGEAFCKRYDITDSGTYEGKNIPNLMGEPEDADALTARLGDPVNRSIPQVYRFRRERAALHRDEKILTGWNGLAAAALAMAARICDNSAYEAEARKLLTFLQRDLSDGSLLFANQTDGQVSGPGFLDDYAFTIFALLQMYKTTKEEVWLSRAWTLTQKTLADYWDEAQGGFFFSGKDNENLIVPVKETYDGALPSGNAAMYYNLSRLEALLQTPSKTLKTALEKHRAYMNRQARAYPAGHCFYLYSLFPAKKIICADGGCRPSDEEIL